VPSKTKKQEGKAEERTREVVTAELERLGQAEQRIQGRQEEIAELLAAGITREIEAREKALRSGYPARPGNKSRELRLELEDLQDQTQDVARMRVRLELEQANLDLADLDRRYRAAQAEAVEIEPRFKEVEAELKQAQLLANNISGARHGVRERINRAKQNLWSLDAAYRVEEEQAVEERRQQQQEGFRRQMEERNAEFDEAVEEQRSPQIQVT